MATGKATLTTREVAAALGVGTSSVKRWADQGLLRCERTPGGHRRIPRAAVAEFLRRDLPVANNGNAAEALLSLLLRETDATRIAEAVASERRARESWCETADALSEIIVRLGQLWESGEIDVVAEHIASARLERALSRCADMIPVFVHAPRCLLVAAPGEDHTLGLSLLEPCAREAGWVTQWAGRRTPISPVFDRIIEGRVQAVAVSASSYSTDAEVLARYADELGEMCRRNGVSLWLGGAGRWPASPHHGHRIRSFRDFDRVARVEAEAAAPAEIPGT